MEVINTFLNKLLLLYETIKMSKKLIALICVLSLFILSACSNQSYAKPKPHTVKVGNVVNTSIESPHPYPNGDSDQKLVWSYVLTHPNTNSLSIHFNRLEVKGEINTPVILETIDYGPCEVNVPQTIPPKEGEVSVPSSSPKNCGNQTIKKAFTSQEIFDNQYVKGDFVVVTNKQGRILDILVEKPLADGWYRSYDTDSIKIELYADNSDIDYGLSIDKYIYGITPQILANENPAPEWVIDKANKHLEDKLGKEYVNKHISFDIAYIKINDEIAIKNFGEPEQEYVVNYNYNFPYFGEDLRTRGGRLSIIVDENGKIQEDRVPNSNHEFEMTEEKAREIAKKSGIENPDKVVFVFKNFVDVESVEFKSTISSKYEYKSNKGRNFIIINDNKGDYIIEVHSESILYNNNDLLTYIGYIDPASGKFLGIFKQISSR